MKTDLTSLVLMVGGVIAAPFAVDGFHEFLESNTEWLPFFLMLFVSTMLLILPIVRPMGTGMMIGIFVFGALLAYQPDWLTWLPRQVLDVPAPF